MGAMFFQGILPCCLSGFVFLLQADNEQYLERAELLFDIHMKDLQTEFALRSRYDRAAHILQVCKEREEKSGREGGIYRERRLWEKGKEKKREREMCAAFCLNVAFSGSRSFFSTVLFFPCYLMV